ncbi:plasmid replication protein repA, partial [Aeromonas veronii]|uniref:plasmid replication protein repA n=1 Tax=Aeromonas veronii TaxID=654 RepID=UPI003F67A8F0
MPHFIQTLIDKVRDYYAKPSLLPTLANLSGKINKLSGKPRQNRSEAREAESLVMQAILSRTDFASLRVGTPLPDGRFIHRTMVEIATIAGMVEDAIDKETKQLVKRPTQRFWRAIRRLKVAGAIDIHQQYETKEDGAIRARPGIKTVNQHFLVALGRISYEKLKAFRTHCSKALKRDSDSHKQQFPDMHDPEIANRRLRDKQREKGI